MEDQMAMAEDELQKTEDLMKMLTDSKTVKFTNLFFFALADPIIYHLSK